MSVSRQAHWLRPVLAILLPAAVIALPMLFGGSQRARADDSVSVMEGDVGATDVPVVISLSVAMDKTAQVRYSTSDSTALAGEDYVPVSGTVVFRPGETRQTVHVSVLGDTVREGDETFYLTTEGSRTTINIIDDDPSIQIGGNTTVMEGDAGVHDMAFVVALTSAPTSATTSTTAVPTTVPAPVPRPVAVNFTTEDGTALAGQDYIPVSGTVVLAAGQTQTIINVPIIGDLIPERDEFFIVRVFDPSRGGITSVAAQGNIINDDAVGFTGEPPPGFGFPGSPPPPGALPSSITGVRAVTASGAVLSAGDAAIFGTADQFHPNAPIVGAASTPSENGYWLVARDGGVFSFGDARFFGSTGGIRLNQPIVGMAFTPTANGYWLVASDGGVFAFGDARFFGSAAGVNTLMPIVGMASTRTGNGYWLVTAGGGVFPFGDAEFFGAVPGGRVNKPIVGMAATPTGEGYWLVGSDGGVFAFGDAGFFGSTGGISLNEPIVGMAPTPTGDGYWLIASDAGLFAFGDAPFLSRQGLVPSKVVAIVR